jgi:hypothetical protein
MAPEMTNVCREEEAHHMINKVDFNTVGMITVCFLVAFLILLSGSVQVSAQKFNIYISGKSNSKTANEYENYLKGKIQRHLLDQYPCASNLTDDEAAALLGWARQRELLGNPDEDAISNVAGALGAWYVVSLNVIQVNGTITMTASGLDDRRGKTVARQSAVSQSGDEALDAAESIAEKFVSDLINSMPDCYVNEWVGKITYNRILQVQSHSTDEGSSGMGTTTEIMTKSVTEANFEVRGTKKSARATVKWNEESLKNAITKHTIPCPDGNTVTRNVKEVEKTTGNAEGKAETVASVSVDGDEYTISFTVPEIDNGIAVRDWTLNDSGGCGPAWSDHQNNSVKWTSPELYEQVKGKIDRSKADVLAGNQTVSGGPPLVPSMKQTTIITWNLTFKRVP